MALGSLLLFFTLAVMLPLELIRETPRFSFDAPTVILYCALIYASARLAYMAFVGERRLLTVTFWLFAYVWGLLSAMLQTGADLFPWGRQVSDDAQLGTAALLIVALLSFELGAWSADLRERIRSNPRALLFSLHWTYFLALVAIVVATAAILSVGGVQVLLQPRGEVSAALWREGGSTALRNILDVALRSVPLVACLSLLFTIRHRWAELSVRSRGMLLVVLLLVVPITIVTNYPDALTRAWLGTVALSFGFLLLPWRRSTLTWVIAGLIAGFVYLFPLADRNRLGSAQAAFPLPVYQSPVVPLLTKGDYDVFVQFANTRTYVAERGYMYGRNLLGSVLFWVPRQWWPDKPLNSGYEVGIHVRNTVVNLSAPLWAEAYLAFGLPGIVLIMGLYGYLIAGWDRRYVRQVHRGIEWGVLRIFVPFWAAYQIFFLRGPLMHTVAYSSIALLLFLLLARWRAVPISSDESFTSSLAAGGHPARTFR